MQNPSPSPPLSSFSLTVPLLEEMLMSVVLEKEWNCAVASGVEEEFGVECSTTLGLLLKPLWVEMYQRGFSLACCAIM